MCDRTFYPGWYGGRRIPYYGITFPLVDKGADEYPITESLFTLVDMGADEYCITEYVNKYKFNKSYQLQLY